MTWTQVLRVVALALGSFSIGFALYVGFLYGKGHYHSGIYRRPWHVTVIIIAWTMMAASDMGLIIDRWDEPAMTWRLPYFTVALGLGTFALYQLAQGRAHKPNEGGETHD